VDFIVTDCGGCGAELKKYGHHLPENAAAEGFSAKVRDISEVLALHADDLKGKLKPLPRTVTWHDSCHIAHAQGIRQQPRALMNLVPGLDVRELNEADACCGSGGTYNIAQPEMSDRVLERKVRNILDTGAEYLVTSNPGCLLQLKKALSETNPKVRVVHLTELLSESMAE
jgi:glycolate oxidase iron-sulfur subunit